MLLWLMFTFVLLPVMEQLFQSMNLDLPVLTRAVLAIGHLARNPIVLLPVLLIPVSLWLSRASIKTWLDESPAGLQLDGLWLRVPLIERRVASRVLYLLALLLDSGCRLSDALDLLTRLSGNRMLSSQFVQVRQMVFEGVTLTEALRECTVFRQDALQLIGAGEESARLGTMALMAARMNEMEADHLTDMMTALLEPILMVVLGIISAILFMAVLMPTSMLISGLS
jgi:type II secretory pathway component PulF